MSGLASTNYRRLDPNEIVRVAAECATAWQDPAIPQRQYDLAVEHELEQLRIGKFCAPFSALMQCLRRLPLGVSLKFPTLLDVGASSGYYSEVLRLANFKCRYMGCDFSEAFAALARTLYPNINYDVADARRLPYPSNFFDIVLHGAVLMHCLEYELAIMEATRVADKYVIFHRTPVLLDKPTEFYVKDAYGVRTLEIWFNQDDLNSIFKSNRLVLVHSETVFMDATERRGHKTYLLAKS